MRLVGIQLALCALLAWPALRFTGRDGLRDMLLAAGVAGTAVVAGYLGLVLLFPRVKSQAVLIAVGGFLVRFALLFALLATLSKTMTVDVGRVVVWMVGFYVVLVMSEAWFLMRAGTPRKEV